MEQIQQQVRRARRRLLLSQAIESVTWWTFAAMLLALVAIAIPKIWPLGLANSQSWWIGWIAGAAMVGLVGGIAWALIRQRGPLDAALEIDLRYGLKERVSSAYALTHIERDSEAGQALIADAQRRVARIDVREHFRPQLNWHPFLPILVAIFAILTAVLSDDAIAEAANRTTEAQKQQIRKSMEELKKRLQERRKKAESTGLKDADALITKVERAVDEFSRQDVDRKKMLVKLNNLTKQLAERREGVEGSKSTRDLLKQLPNTQRGPADRVTDALKKGDMEQAMDELKKLSDKLRSDDLSAEEKQRLVEQLEQMRQEMEKMLGARQELQNRMNELQNRMNQLKKEGKNSEAGDLQRQLDQLQQQMDQLDRQNPQLNKLQELANKLGQCAECMQNGNGQQAADQLDQLASDLQQMQQQLEDLQTLDEMMDEIADAKAAMNCQNCGGAGCEECQGMQQGMSGGGDQFSEEPGQGMGAGRGYGPRPEEKTQTGGYRARVAGDPRQGEAVRVGDASGPNVSGQSRQQVKEEIASSYSEDPSPLNHQKLPRRERDQTREYFELLRKGD